MHWLVNVAGDVHNPTQRKRALRGAGFRIGDHGSVELQRFQSLTSRITLSRLCCRYDFLRCILGNNGPARGMPGTDVSRCKLRVIRPARTFDEHAPRALLAFGLVGGDPEWCGVRMCEE